MGCASSKTAAERAAAEKAAAERAAAEEVAAERAAAEKGSDRHLWQAARDNDEPELRRLIGLGWNVNWHDPVVRRRMRLAWAPASFCLYMLEVADTAPFFATAKRAASALVEPPPRRHAGLCIRALDGPAGRPPRAPAEVGLPHSIRRPRGPDGQRS